MIVLLIVYGLGLGFSFLFVVAKKDRALGLSQRAFLVEAAAVAFAWPAIVIPAFLRGLVDGFIAGYRNPRATE
jgi:hypothetical protein